MLDALGDGGVQRLGELAGAFGARRQMFDVDDAAVVGQFVQQDLEGGGGEERDGEMVREPSDESQRRNYGRVAGGVGAAMAGDKCPPNVRGSGGGDPLLWGAMFSVSVSSSAHWMVLRVHGEIDMSTCPLLRQEIVRQIESGHHHLVIDLEGVDFIDSTGLGVLIGGLKRTRSRDGDLRVSGVDERLGKVFDLTGLRDVLAVCDRDDPDITLGAA